VREEIIDPFAVGVRSMSNYLNVIGSCHIIWMNQDILPRLRISENILSCKGIYWTSIRVKIALVHDISTVRPCGSPWHRSG